MCLPDATFPSTRSRVYKPALWTLTQITLPTPTGMKTKPQEGIAARFPRLLSRPSLPAGNSRHCLSAHSSAVPSSSSSWRGVVALTDGMWRPASAGPCSGLQSHILLQCSPVTWGDPWLPLLSTGSMRMHFAAMNPAVDTGRGVEGNPSEWNTFKQTFAVAVGRQRENGRPCVPSIYLASVELFLQGYEKEWAMADTRRKDKMRGNEDGKEEEKNEGRAQDET